MRKKVYIKQEEKQVDIINKVNITSGFLLLLTAVTVLSGLRTTAVTVLAAGVHELGHLTAIWLAGGQVTGFRLGAGGAELSYRARLSYGLDAGAALAGPAASGFLAALAGLAWELLRWPWLLELTAVSALYGAVNLLPAGALDGGRALRAGVSMLFGPAAAHWTGLILDMLIAALALTGGAYAFFVWKIGASPLICALFLINACCKIDRSGVKY